MKPAVIDDLECPRCGGSGRIANPAATGALFRGARLAQGLSLRAVARRARFSAAYVSDLERGRRAWTLAAQLRIGRAISGMPGGSAPRETPEDR